MKKYLLLIISMVCAVTGAWAENAVVTYNQNSPSTITVETKDDPDLSGNYAKMAIWNNQTEASVSDQDVFTWSYDVMKVVGTISQTGLNQIVSKNTDTGKFDMSQATQSSTDPWISFPSIATSVILANDTQIPNITWGSNTNYVYSAASTGDNYYLYVKSGVTPSQISELNTSELTGNKVLHISGPGAKALKTELLASPYSVNSANIDVPFDGSITVTSVSAGGLQTAVEAALAAEGGTASSQITNLKISGTLNDTDLQYISGLTNLTTLDLSGVTSIVSMLTSSSLVNLKLPSNATALPTNLATGCPNVNSAWVYVSDANACTSLDIYVRNAGLMTDVVNEIKTAKTSNQDLTWMVSNATVKITGALNSTDKSVISTQFVNAKIFDLTDATGFTAADLTGHNGHEVIKLPKGSEMPTNTVATSLVKNSGSGPLLIYSLSTNGEIITIWEDAVNRISGAITANNAIGGYTGVQYAKIVGRENLNFSSDETALTNHNINIARDPLVYNGCEVTINRAFSTKTMAELLSEATTHLGSTQMCTIKVVGEVSAADLTALNETNASGVSRIDLGEATLASGVAITSLSNLPTALTSLVLPAGQTVSGALVSTLTSCTNLMYAYSPTTDNQTKAEQFVADYVWMNQAGGLAAAVTNEAKLKTAVYVKVESDVANSVALNSADCDLTDKGISDSNDGNHGWQYIDLSGTLLTAQDALDFKSPHYKAFRIILPNNVVTNEHMAMFASNSNIGAIAAVYTYNTATNTLKIMECVDNSYDPAALADPRIMKSGTQEVKLVSGYYNGNTYATFGTNLLAALNNMGKSNFTVGETNYTNTVGTGVTKISIETTSAAPSALTFDNPTVTTLEIKNFQNTNVELNVDACSALTILDLTSSGLKTVDASTTSLTTANLAGTSFSGAADFSGATSLATFNTTDETRFGGDLNLTSSVLTSFTSEATFGGNLKLNASNSLGSVDVSGATFTNSSSEIHVDNDTDEEGNDIITGLKKTDGIKVPSSFAETVGTRVHPYNSSYVTVASAVVPAYTFAASDKVFHEKELGEGDVDKFRYWYQGTMTDDKEVTLGTSDSRTLASVLTDNASTLNFGSTTYNKVKVVGPVTNTDVAQLTNLNCIALDLSEATFDETALAALKTALANTSALAVHSNVKFLYLPDGSTRDELINQTALAGLANSVYCVMSTADNATDGGIDLTSYSFQSGSLQPAVTIFQNSSAQSWTTIKTGYSNTSPKYASNVSTFKKLKIGGLINSYDLAGPAQSLQLDDDGHLSWTEAADEGNYGQKRTLNGGNTVYGPFSASFNLTEIDLRDAYFEEYGNNTGLDVYHKRYWFSDMTLSALSLISTATYKVVIPQDSRVHELPADFMNCSTNIRAICIPSNIQAIRTRAFWTIDYVWTTADAFAGGHDPEGSNTRLDNGAKLNDGTQVNALLYNTTTQKYEENTAFLDSYYTADYSGVNGGGSYTFGSTLKLIESGAFANTQPNVKDVYVLNTTAPECHVDAFNTVMYTGNGGYNPSSVTTEGIITREAYYNGRWITMLHYPRQTTDPNIQRYTDPTREYSIATGERDGKGAIIYFPNQSEFIRAYQQGTFGYTWRAWNPTRTYGSVNNGDMTNTTIGWNAEGQSGANALFDAYSTGTDHQYRSFYKVSGFGTTDGITAPTTALVPYYNVNWSGSYSTVTPQANLYPQSELESNTDSDNSGEKTSKDYRGWHQFVLNAYAANTVLDEEPYRSYITDNEWWTICPEFDITLHEAAILFGKSKDVGTTSGVDVYPRIHKLKYVRRTYSDGVIHLCFTKDLTQFKEERANSTVTYTYDTGESTGEITGLTNADQHGSLKNDGTGIISLSSDSPAADDVVMSAGVPYLIKPNMPMPAKRQYIIFKSALDAQNYKSTHTAATDPIGFGNPQLYFKIKQSQSLSGSDQRAMIKSGTYTVPVFVLDYSGSKYTMENVEEDNGTKTKFRPNDDVTSATEYYRSADRHYTFVGTFYKSFLPHYSYFLGWDSKNSCAKFYYHNGNFPTIDNEMRWANGTGVIVPTLATDLEGNPLAFKYSVTEASDMAHPAQWDLQTKFADDSFVKAGSSAPRVYVMDIDSPDMQAVNGAATAIMNVNTDENMNVNKDEVSVYTLDGRKVANSLQGLSQGIYIVNGKKYVVK